MPPSELHSLQHCIGKGTISFPFPAYCLCNSPQSQPSPDACSHPRTLLGTKCLGEGPAVPHLPQLDVAATYHLLLGVPAQGGTRLLLSPCPLCSVELSPASPALPPLSLVPAACGLLSLALCLPPPPPTHGLRQRAGISCQCWAGDTQLRLLPICHPRGHLPLTSCSSAERHRHENPPTWQKAELNGGGWQK